jgi:hypothetical protein
MIAVKTKYLTLVPILTLFLLWSGTAFSQVKTFDPSETLVVSDIRGTLDYGLASRINPEEYLRDITERLTWFEAMGFAGIRLMTEEDISRELPQSILQAAQKVFPQELKKNPNFIALMKKGGPEFFRGIHWYTSVMGRQKIRNVVILENDPGLLTLLVRDLRALNLFNVIGLSMEPWDAEVRSSAWTKMRIDEWDARRFNLELSLLERFREGPAIFTSMALDDAEAKRVVVRLGGLITEEGKLKSEHEKGTDRSETLRNVQEEKMREVLRIVRRISEGVRGK